MKERHGIKGCEDIYADSGEDNMDEHGGGLLQ